MDHGSYRHVTSAPTYQTAASGVFSQIIGAASYRVGWIIFPDSAAALNIVFDSPTGITNFGALTPSAGPLLLTRDMVGDLVTRSVFIAGVGASVKVTVVELFEIPEGG